MLHASVGDVHDVLVNGKFIKRDGKLAVKGYGEVRERFLKSAKKLQDIWAKKEYPILEGKWQGSDYADTLKADVIAGEGDGYGELFIE
ncbi:unnamed protein product [Fusarium graminearum]|nr:unnamed protein product [Fusarium graminearum]